MAKVMNEVSIIVKRIIANELMSLPYTVDKIELTHKLGKDLAADSLDLVCIAIEIEKEFGIVINDSEIELVETVGELIEMVEKSVKNK